MTECIVRWCAAVSAFTVCVCVLACSGNPQTQNANTPPSSQVRNANSNASPAAAGNPLAGNSEGNHDLTNCEGVYGWAWDGTQPNSTVKVDIYDGETLLGTAEANLLRADLTKAGKGDGRHAFSFILPASIKDGRQHLIRVKITGTNVTLGTPQSISCTPR